MCVCVCVCGMRACMCVFMCVEDRISRTFLVFLSAVLDVDGGETEDSTRVPCVTMALLLPNACSEYGRTVQVRSPRVLLATMVWCMQDYVITSTRSTRTHASRCSKRHARGWGARRRCQALLV